MPGHVCKAGNRTPRIIIIIIIMSGYDYRNKCFQFAPKHCQWWNRCNIIWKTMPQLWVSRSKMIVRQLWRYTTDSKLVGRWRRKSPPGSAYQLSAQPIRHIPRRSPVKSSVDNDRLFELDSLGSSKPPKNVRVSCDVSRAAKTSDWRSCSVEHGLL